MLTPFTGALPGGAFWGKEAPAGSAVVGEAVLRADALERGSSGAGTTPDEGEGALFKVADGGLVWMVLESVCVGALVMRASHVGARDACMFVVTVGGRQQISCRRCDATAKERRGRSQRAEGFRNHVCRRSNEP